jgi:hypothetical protein
MFKKAGHAEIIRSHQKDDYYISDLKSQITDIFQALIGTFNQLSCHFVDLQILYVQFSMVKRGRYRHGMCFRASSVFVLSISN